MHDIEEMQSNKNIPESNQSRLYSAVSTSLKGLFESSLSNHMEHNLLEPKNNDQRFDLGARTFMDRHNM